MEVQGGGSTEGGPQRDVKFLYDAFSPWGQGATVIQPHRGAVQKPPHAFQTLPCSLGLWEGAEFWILGGQQDAGTPAHQKVTLYAEILTKKDFWGT